MFYDEIAFTLEIRDILSDFVIRDNLRKFFNDNKTLCLEFAYLKNAFEVHGYDETMEVVKHVLRYYENEDKATIEKMEKSFAGEEHE